MGQDQNAAFGEQIAGRYRLLRVLGRGGMGVVYEAVDVRLDRRVAVKLLTAVEGLTEDNDSLNRFLREVRALARIDHPGVVTLHDGGVYNGVPYLVMQVIDGVNLARLVADGGPLPAAGLAHVALGVLGALSAAHEAGVLHRDIKPSNISITRDGRVVLQDFGLARLAGEVAITRTGALVGTPQFMAPEVIRGGLPGPAADVYGLGACMYFMVTGKLPFGETRDVGAVVEHALGHGIPRLNGMGVDCPQTLVQLIDRLCDQEPEQRQDIAAAMRVLGPSARGGADEVAETIADILRSEVVESVIDERSGAPVAASASERGEPHPPLPSSLSQVGLPEYRWDSLTVSEAGRASAIPSPTSRDMVDLPSLTNRTRHLALSAMTAESALSRQREAVNLVLRGALREAAEMFSVIVPVCLSALGPGHPTTLTGQYWQGVCLARLGAGAEAVELFSRVNRQVDQERGPGHD